MFKFLFGRGPALRYDVFYTFKGSTWTMKATLLAGSEYEANRIFDTRYGDEYDRVANATRLASSR
ncbi:hypothetical protein SCRES3_gp31 [Synechococcus phage S-CRES3]|nr:hypothetical protein SCRES3_gp31 [Synechococcus phage S-CRES3]